MVKVAEATAHAMYFQVPLFLCHQQVMELEAFLVVRSGGPQEIPEVHLVQKERRYHQRRGRLVRFVFRCCGVLCCVVMCGVGAGVGAQMCGVCVCVVCVCCL